MITWVGVTVIVGALTMNDPKYAVVAPLTWKKSPLTRFIGRTRSTSTRTSSWNAAAAPR